MDRYGEVQLRRALALEELAENQLVRKGPVELPWSLRPMLPWEMELAAWFGPQGAFSSGEAAHISVQGSCW